MLLTFLVGLVSMLLPRTVGVGEAVGVLLTAVGLVNSGVGVTVGTGELVMDGAGESVGFGEGGCWEIISSVLVDMYVTESISWPFLSINLTISAYD